MKVFDMHVHVFPEALAKKAVDNLGKYYNIEMKNEGTYKSLQESLEKTEVIKKCLIHATATVPHQIKSVNEFISNFISDSVLGFGSVHPARKNIEEEIDYIIKLGLRGIKLHPDFQAFDADCENACKIYEYAQNKLPVLFHVGDLKSDRSHPRKIRHVHDMFPNLKIIAAHLGGYTKWDEAEEFLIGEDVWFDTSSTLQCLPPERVETIIRKHGIERCVFGTDFPMHNQAYVIDEFMKLNFSKKEFEDILWKNMHRFLKIDE